jgi:hypothetical protein
MNDRTDGWGGQRDKRRERCIRAWLKFEMLYTLELNHMHRYIPNHTLLSMHKRVGVWIFFNLCMILHDLMMTVLILSQILMPVATALKPRTGLHPVLTRATVPSLS